MNIQYKEMILKVKKLDDTRYTREVYDRQDNLVWSGGIQYYIHDGLEVMNAARMTDLIEQMKKLPTLNIVEVINDFAQ